MDKTPRADDAGAFRERYWRRRLGRLQLGAEPLGEQLERYRRVTLVLTAIAVIVGAMFVALFAAFGRAEIGAILALVLLAPVIAIAWLDQALLRRRVRDYLREFPEDQAGRPEKGPA